MRIHLCCSATHGRAKLVPHPPGGGGGGAVLGSIFAGYVPPASQNPYTNIVYSVAKL